MSVCAAPFLLRIKRIVVCGAEWPVVETAPEGGCRRKVCLCGLGYGEIVAIKYVSIRSTPAICSDCMFFCRRSYALTAATLLSAARLMRCRASVTPL